MPWQNWRVTESAHSKNLPVYGSHCGLGVNGTVFYLIANRLGPPTYEWQPFEAKGIEKRHFSFKKLGPVDKLIGPEARSGDVYEAEIAC